MSQGASNMGVNIIYNYVCNELPLAKLCKCMWLG